MESVTRRACEFVSGVRIDDGRISAFIMAAVVVTTVVVPRLGVA